ncbi:MAG TPA: hypothetical protein VHQ90_24375 [Thermoanaerobaculia bacterium]|nr:hypothetical protein [Thermoanaerobaculia bacterium]
MADGRGFADSWRRANDTLLAPLVVLPSLGMAAVNALVGATARLAAGAVQAAGGALGTPGKVAEQFSERVAARTLGAAKESTDTALQAVRNAAGGMAGPGSNQLLSTTFLDKGTATAALPLLIGWDAVGAMIKEIPAIRGGAYDLWLELSKFLDTRSSHGVLTGRQSFDAASLSRFGFIDLALAGPIQAVARDFRGIVGGVVALGMGDFNWLAQAAKDYWASMEYVYDKWLAGETQPQADFPIGKLLASEARQVIQRFPRPFVRALESGDPVQVVKALNDDAGEIFTMLSLYPFTAFQVLYDVLVFILKAWLQVEDACDYALCELAVVESNLGDEDKEFAMERLRKTAGNATVEFEYYVPLLVPFGGTPADQAHRTGVTGKLIDEHTIAQSVFRQEAIWRAQSINSEVIQLRAFLWLFRDEATAREKSFRETARKFGQAVADRIERERKEGRSLYPLKPEDVADLMKPDRFSNDVPRTPEEVNLVLYLLLRRRGLLYVADKVCGDQPFIAARGQRFSADYRPELAMVGGG